MTLYLRTGFLTLPYIPLSHLFVIIDLSLLSVLSPFLTLHHHLTSQFDSTFHLPLTLHLSRPFTTFHLYLTFTFTPDFTEGYFYWDNEEHLPAGRSIFYIYMNVCLWVFIYPTFRLYLISVLTDLLLLLIFHLLWPLNYPTFHHSLSFLPLVSSALAEVYI